MFSRAARLSTRVAAPVRARVAAPRVVIPSIAARRSVTTNAASAQLEKPLPEVRLFTVDVGMSFEVGFDGDIVCVGETKEDWREGETP